jgi:hypothetical protein
MKEIFLIFLLVLLLLVTFCQVSNLVSLVIMCEFFRLLVLISWCLLSGSADGSPLLIILLLGACEAAVNLAFLVRLRKKNFFLKKSLRF